MYIFPNFSKIQEALKLHRTYIEMSQQVYDPRKFSWYLKEKLLPDLEQFCMHIYYSPWEGQVGVPFEQAHGTIYHYAKECERKLRWKEKPRIPRDPSHEYNMNSIFSLIEANLQESLLSNYPLLREWAEFKMRMNHATTKED